MPDEVPADIGLLIAAEEHPVREDDRALPGALERRDQVEEKRIIAVLRRRDAILKAFELVVLRVEPVRPGFGGEGRICDREVELLQAPVGVLEVRVGKGIAAPDLRPRMAVEDHIHPRQRPGGVIHLLAVDRDSPRGFVTRLEEEGPRPAGRVVEGLVLAGIRTDADHTGDDPRDLGRGVELPFALARLGGEMPHQVLVGITEQIVALGAVCPEVQAVEDRHQFGEAVLHLFPAPELRLIVEISLVDDPLEPVRLCEPADNLVDLIPDLLVALQPHHIGEASSFRHLDDRVLLPRVLIGDVFYEEQREYVILVL
ncbi:hypothetical protein DSECCO2_589160 [anaerobic digester metagenome]